MYIFNIAALQRNVVPSLLIWPKLSVGVHALFGHAFICSSFIFLMFLFANSSAGAEALQVDPSPSS